MTDWKIVYAEVKAFDDGREVVKAMRSGIREPVPEIRDEIRKRALGTMPRRGGLAKWVAASRVSASVKFSSRRVSLRLKGGRNSAGGRSDLTAIDAGRVRAPSWGRKGLRQWHVQAVPSGFFTRPAADGADRVFAGVDRAVDSALDMIREG